MDPQALPVSKEPQDAKDPQVSQVSKVRPEREAQLELKVLKDFLFQRDHEVLQVRTVVTLLKAPQDLWEFQEPPGLQEKHHREEPQVQLVPKEALDQQEDPDLMVLLVRQDPQDSRAF